MFPIPKRDKSVKPKRSATIRPVKPKRPVAAIKPKQPKPPIQPVKAIRPRPPIGSTSGSGND